MYTATCQPIPIPPPPRPDSELPAAIGISRPVLADILVAAAKAAGATYSCC
jgi:hypothetical protein